MGPLFACRRRRGSAREHMLGLLLLFLAGVILAGCGGSSASGGSPGTNGGGVSVSTNASSTIPTGATAVSFTTSDGITLSGHLFGTGPSAVVLCHMYPADQTSWYDTARLLAARGYLALTFDFRGYGSSGGEKQIEYLDRDVLAAVQRIAAAGASRVVLVGASMGGTAALVAAPALLAGQESAAAGAQAASARHPVVAGVATLSAPVSFKGLSAESSVSRISCPLLFIAAEKDAGASGARQLEQLSENAGDLQIVPGSDHGTNLLNGAQAGTVRNLLLAFLKKTLPQ